MEIVSTDVDVVSDLARQLKVAGNRLENQIEDIYKIIADMGNSWSGDSYQDFVSKCNNSRKSLDALVLFVKAYSRLFETTVKDAAEDYVTEVAAALGGN